MIRSLNKFYDAPADYVLFDSDYLGPLVEAVPNGQHSIWSPNDSISLALRDELRFKLHDSLIKRAFTYFNYLCSLRFEKKICFQVLSKSLCIAC